MKRISRLTFSAQLKLATDGGSLPILLDQFRHQGGPAGLVAGADAGAVVAVEVFMERDEVAPMGIVLEFFRAAEDRPAAMLVAQKYARQALRNFAGDCPRDSSDLPEPVGHSTL